MYIEKKESVSSDACVSGNACVSGDAWVSGNAWVLGDAWVSGDARVSGNAWEVSPTQIQGSRHFVTHSKRGHITIGCHTLEIKEWKKKYKIIGKANNYTKEQIIEYGDYIKIIEKADKRMIKLYWDKK